MNLFHLHSSIGNGRELLWDVSQGDAPRSFGLQSQSRWQPKEAFLQGELDYDKAYRFALFIEASERDSNDLKAVGHRPIGERNYFNSGGKNMIPDFLKQPGTVVCYQYGGTHLAPVYKFKETECLFCMKKGHLAQICRAKAKAWEGRKKSSKQPSHLIETR